MLQIPTVDRVPQLEAQRELLFQQQIQHRNCGGFFPNDIVCASQPQTSILISIYLDLQDLQGSEATLGVGV